MLDLKTIKAGLITEGYPLVAQYLPAIHHLAFIYAKKLPISSSYSCDTEGVFNILLMYSIKCSKVFDPTRGASLLTFIKSRALVNIYAELLPIQSTISQNYIPTIKRYVELFETTYGYYPTLNQIVIGTGISREEVLDKFFHMVSLVPLEDFDGPTSEGDLLDSMIGKEVDELLEHCLYNSILMGVIDHGVDQYSSEVGIPPEDLRAYYDNTIKALQQQLG